MIPDIAALALANIELNAVELAQADACRDALLAERRALIIEARAAGLTLRVIGESYGVSTQAVSNVLRREKAKAS